MSVPTKSKTEHLLKLAFRLGALTDGLAIIPLLSPEIGIDLFGGDPSKIGPEYRFAMGIGASLMAGWTALLIWGSLKPVERRGILLITVLPVVAGIVAATVYGVSNNVLFLRRMIPLWVHLGCISALYIVAWLSIQLQGAKNSGEEGA